MQIKVKDTRMHKPKNWEELSEGKNKDYSYPVVEAKLVLVKCKDIIPMSNQLAKNKITGSLFIVTVNNKNDGYLVKPILISETEKIEVGDWCWLSTHGGFIITQCQPHSVITDQKGISDVWHKILALPEHFSSKHLQAIVDGKMKDGDRLLIECEKDEESMGKLDWLSKIKLNPHVTIYSVEEKMYTRDEVIKEGNKLADHIQQLIRNTFGCDYLYNELKVKSKEWFEQNVK